MVKINIYRWMHTPVSVFLVIFFFVLLFFFFFFLLWICIGLRNVSHPQYAVECRIIKLSNEIVPTYMKHPLHISIWERHCYHHYHFEREHIHINTSFFSIFVLQQWIDDWTSNANLDKLLEIISLMYLKSMNFWNSSTKCCALCERNIFFKLISLLLYYIL